MIGCYEDLRNNVREQESFKNVVIGNTMKNRIKRNIKKIKKSHAGGNWMQRELHSQSQEGNGISEKIKPHKKTPKHGQTQVHKDKTKTIPRKDKYPSPNYEGPWSKDLGL